MKFSSNTQGQANMTTMTTMTTTMCIKVKELRKHGYADLEEWMGREGNEYVGRRGRIWITDPETKEKRMFHYKASKWANPFKVGKQYTLQESLFLYEEHLAQSGLIVDVEELKGKCLGCFCEQGDEEKCHAQVLARLASTCEKGL